MRRAHIARYQTADQESGILGCVAAYDAFAPYYSSYSLSRTAYLRAIEDIIIAHAGNTTALLDVGAGDGSRSLRIARAVNATRVVLVEPSAGMRARCPADVEIWPYSASELPVSLPQFDLIISLWNVLGHVEGPRGRLVAISKLRELLSPGGAIFLDVCHRYNASSYGWTRTVLRMVSDCFSRSEEQGDVVVTWPANGQTIRTHGHVFTPAEMAGLFRAAGLKIVRRWVINYEVGASRRMPFLGHLFYQLTRA